MKGTKLFSGLIVSCFIILLVVTDLSAYPLVSEELAGKLTDGQNEMLTVIIGLKDHGDGYGKLPEYVTDEFRTEYLEHLKRVYTSYCGDLFRYMNNKKRAKGGEQIVFSPLWLSNAIIFRGNESALNDLVLNDKDKIESIHISRSFHMVGFEKSDPIDGSNEDARPEGPYTYGLSKIRINELAQLYPYVTGKGVRVGHLDTGVNPKHPDLEGKILAFRDFSKAQISEGGYYSRGGSDAYDDNNHGSHTAGTIVGGASSGTRIGVAPGASLIVGKIFNTQGSADEAEILEAMQWVADPDGDPKTRDGAMVVSNSWGGIPGTPEQEKPLWNAVSNWINMGIFPVFAAGNEGPNGATMSTPGGYPQSFSVGATDSQDLVASFSSRGPFDFGGVTFNKPDISAPGVNVYSATANGKWAKFSGTSMATPHVAGLVALMLSVNQYMNVDQIARWLTYYTRDVDQEGYDFNTGWGRIDAMKVLGNMVNSQLELPFP
jgi:subtilisin family serine protease